MLIDRDTRAIRTQFLVYRFTLIIVKFSTFDNMTFGQRHYQITIVSVDF